MARRKTKQVRFQYELNGIILILIAIIGYGRYGIVGRFISSLAIVAVGFGYQILLFSLLLIGLYMVFKRDIPKFFNSKLIGIYLFALSSLTLLHVSYISKYSVPVNNMIKDALNFYSIYLKDIAKEAFNVSHSGGLVGALTSTGLIKLFDIPGTKILAWVFLATGILIFTGASFFDSLRTLVSKFKWNINFKKNREEIEAVAEEYDNDKKIVVSSVEELVHMKDEPKDEKKEQLSMNDFNIKGYSYPPITILHNPIKMDSKANHDAIKATAATLEQVFSDFALKGKVVGVNVGPSVTQFEMEIEAGTKVSRVESIHKEIALALAAKEIRIQAPIPGKRTIGVEVPNRITALVTVREVLEKTPKSFGDSKLLVTLGKNIMGEPIFLEINKTPHLLVAGATGSGKSVCINSMIISILMRTRPDEVKLVLIDPKRVELSIYNGVPHLLAPVVTDPRRASVALKKIVSEMERRYEAFQAVDTKNIAAYNTYVEKKNKGLPESEQLKKIPYIVVIIDELADLMIIAAKEVEDSIMRITQMARAAGIHLIVATQRPSTDVITGLIKSNIPSRISFAVSSSIDSRTILDMMGAEKLLGRGDMLFLPMGENTPIRVQGSFISDEEIKAVCDFTIAQQKARYDETLIMDNDEMGATSSVGGRDDYDEPLYNEIVTFVVEQGKASASLLQRRFRLGYNRAARVIDLLEERGVIGPNNGSKPRNVLITIKKED